VQLLSVSAYFSYLRATRAAFFSLLHDELLFALHSPIEAHTSRRAAPHSTSIFHLNDRFSAKQFLPVYDDRTSFPSQAYDLYGSDVSCRIFAARLLLN